MCGITDVKLEDPLRDAVHAITADNGVEVMRIIEPQSRQAGPQDAPLVPMLAERIACPDTLLPPFAMGHLLRQLPIAQRTIRCRCPADGN